MPDPSHFSDLLAGGWRDLSFSPFREGIEICWLHDEGENGGSALLRYEPGASAPLHLHQGLETVIVLEGSQSDERGIYRTGSVVTNPPGYRHSVLSEEGCVVLICWAKPVAFV